MFKINHLSRILIFLCIAWNDAQSRSCDPLSNKQRDQLQASAASSSDALHEALIEAFMEVERDIESREAIMGRNRQKDIASSRHCFYQNSNKAPEKSKFPQEKIEAATTILMNRYDLTMKDINIGLSQIKLSTVLQNDAMEDCVERMAFNCSRYTKYRTINGSCNNLKNAYWGMATTCLERLIEPAYSDGISAMRLSVFAHPLPLPRKVSIKIHTHKNKPADNVNHMLMQWGLVLSHDLVQAPLHQQGDRFNLDDDCLTCCPEKENNHPQCAPLIIEPGDPFFHKAGIECLENSRSAICPTCNAGPRQQINQVSSFIDASPVYGNSMETMNKLRVGKYGLLKTQENDLLLESDIPESDCCSFQDPDHNCFMAGDYRVNFFPELTAMHTIFLRHHNNMARRLKELNPRWSDEKLFQDVRKIIGAQFQMITYNEYLPLIIGQEYMDLFHLNIKNESNYTVYDPSVDSTVTNEFAVAAFRFIYSQINSFFLNNSSKSATLLRDSYFYPFDLYKLGNLEAIVRGLLKSPPQMSDRYMIPDVINHLFQLRKHNSGLDIAALDILRGRDHGIPSYVGMVNFCRGPEIHEFKDLDQLMNKDEREKMEDVYESPYDIDLFSGGLSERPLHKAIVGPTFACIIGLQFNHLKFGDRFYFEHGKQSGSFTPEQLHEIRKTTLSKIICNSTNIDKIQYKVFLNADDNKNPEVACYSLPEPNLEVF